MHNEVSRKDEDRTPHFSYSQWNMHNRCPRQYYYRYIQGIKTPPTIQLGSGKAIHAALETNSKHKMSKKVDMDIDMLNDVLSTEHDKEMSDVEDADAKAKGKDKDASLSILGLYRRTQAPSITPIAVEFGFEVVLEGDEHSDSYMPVIGFVDSYAAVPDTREGPTKGKPIIALEDYKKVSRRKSQLEVDLSPQLTLYDYVYNLQTDGLTTDVLGLRQMGHNGPRSQSPGPYVEAIYRSPEGLTPEVRRAKWERVLNQMKMAQRQIQTGDFMPVDNPMICGWCGYKPICQPEKR